MELIDVDPQLLMKWNRPVPRYTSYPTAPQFVSLSEADAPFERFAESDKPLSLYIHIPFCRTMCLFCACSVILNRRADRQAEYLGFLRTEIDLLVRRFPAKRRVTQLHLGGGTPTSLSVAEFEELMAHLRAAFAFDPAAEISIEIDPRTVYADQGEKLTALRRLGFNRVSFGVQDLDPVVQKAVRRFQSEEMTVSTYWKARELGFSGINLDLIYGLPFQTVASFRKTVEKICVLQPDRIALFSYAKVPWLKPHQKAMPEEAEPSAEEKFRIYVEARSLFMKSGYEAIGMDHFSLQADPLSEAYRNQTLWRNFQGYSICLAEDLIGLGVTSIGFLENAFLQNAKTIDEYKTHLAEGRLPLVRGCLLTEEDRRRRWVIQTLMCHFELEKGAFERQFGIPFDAHFASVQGELDRLQEEGLLVQTRKKLIPTPIGRLLIRLIAAAFDAYLMPQQTNYSKSI